MRICGNIVDAVPTLSNSAAKNPSVPIGATQLHGSMPYQGQVRIREAAGGISRLKFMPCITRKNAFSRE